MSRLAKKPIKIPAEVKFSLEGRKVFISGPRGSLSYNVPEELALQAKEDSVSVARLQDTKIAKSKQGLFVRLIQNALTGVTSGWSKTLELVGTGYRARLEGEKLVLSIGFSHPVVFEPHSGLAFSVKENTITVSGADKEAVGQIAATIRDVRKPEPYQGKGIRYKDEVVRRKAGKSAKTATA